MPIWPGENDLVGGRKTGEGGTRGPDTREVRETLAKPDLSLSSS